MINKEIAKKFFYEGIYYGRDYPITNPLFYDKKGEFEKLYEKIVKEKSTQGIDKERLKEWINEMTTKYKDNNHYKVDILKNLLFEINHGEVGKIIKENLHEDLERLRYNIEMDFIHLRILIFENLYNLLLVKLDNPTQKIILNKGYFDNVFRDFRNYKFDPIYEKYKKKEGDEKQENFHEESFYEDFVKNELIEAINGLKRVYHGIHNKPLDQLLSLIEMLESRKEKEQKKPECQKQSNCSYNFQEDCTEGCNIIKAIEEEEQEKLKSTKEIIEEGIKDGGWKI